MVPSPEPCAAPSGGESSATPAIRLRGRNLLALVVAPEFPMAAWFAALDAEVRASGPVLGRPVVADLSQTLDAGGMEAVEIVLEGLEARGLRLIGIEGVPAGALAPTRWAGLAAPLPGRNFSPEAAPRPRVAPAPTLAPAPPRTSAGLVLDRPIRSGQTVVFEDGDITVIGAIASGAEVVAGGSLHVYGPLRGRAIAGLRAGETARIFCSRLEAEMVGVGRLYRTAEHWGPALHGRPAQIWCDRGALRLGRLT